MLNFSNLMIGSSNPKKLGEYYKEVFEEDPEMEEGGWYGWLIGKTYFSIGEHSEVSGKAKEPQRVILNFETNQVEEEFERIKNIEGTEVIKEPYEMEGAWIATLADPDGNYFQLMTPWSN
jgi:predicted enzyme related to lactoylglutathione lyase